MGLDIKTKENKRVRVAGWNECVEGLVGRKVSRGWGNDSVKCSLRNPEFLSSIPSTQLKARCGGLCL